LRAFVLPQQHDAENFPQEIFRRILS